MFPIRGSKLFTHCLPLSFFHHQDPAVDGATGTVDETTAKRRQSARTRLFLRLLINCIVQYELIQTVDNILFFSSRNRQEDALILQEARRSSALLNSHLLMASAGGSGGQRVPSGNTSLSSPQQARTPEEKRLLEAVTGGDGNTLTTHPSADTSSVSDLAGG